MRNPAIFEEEIKTWKRINDITIGYPEAKNLLKYFPDEDGYLKYPRFASM